MAAGIELKLRRAVGTANERDGTGGIAEVIRDATADPIWVSSAALTLADEHQGRCLVVTVACTVTIPAGLRPGFSCGWAQAGTGAITFAAGAGLTLRSADGLKSAGQYRLGGLAALALNEVWLYGGLTA